MKKRSSKGIRSAALLVADLVCILLSLWLSLWIRFAIDSGQIPFMYFNRMLAMLPLFCVCTILIFARMRLYKSLWSYASLAEAGRVVGACAMAVILFLALGVLFDKLLPRSCYFILFALLTMLTLGVRFGYRFVRTIRSTVVNRRSRRDRETAVNVMLIGAGSAGRTLIHEINHDTHLAKSHVVCVIDDAPDKQQHYFCGVLVVGGLERIRSAAEEYHVDEILFAIPSADSKTKRRFLEECQKTGCRLKTLPGVYQLVDGEVMLNQVRQVDVTDLLGREPIRLDMKGIRSLIQDKCVLITGAGGSIGSELSRQVASYRPRTLVLADIYENTTYFLENELREAYPELNLVVLIGSVRDEGRMEHLFARYRPQVVFHAAAHKHVPLMEDSPNEAIKNNVFGTLNLVRLSDRYQVGRFVLISTDKAVNPTNVMGASKRICEMIVQLYNRRSKTEYAAVRFGNVLGSNGSVIPIFQKQIEQGGPVTVTHPDIIRYFMTIPEAVSLVLQAGAFAAGGEIFVLDMGEPVKILTLAENMIRLSGHVPDGDIKIVFSGLRPGEKLFEEMLMGEEGLTATQNRQIFIGSPLQLDSERFFRQLEALRTAMTDEEHDIRPAILEIVPNCHFRPSEAEEPTVRPEERGEAAPLSAHT